MLKEFPEAIIIRPASIFGWEDRFLNRFVKLGAILPLVPLVNEGRAKVQPVFVENVADGILSSLNKTDGSSQIFDLGGPDVLSLREVTEMVCELTRKKSNFTSSPKWLALVLAQIMERSPWSPILTQDDIKSMMEDDIVPESSQGLSTLAITPVSIHTKAKLILGAFRSGGRAFPETTPY